MNFKMNKKIIISLTNISFAKVFFYSIDGTVYNADNLNWCRKYE